jgi:hypothetical protein
VATSTRLATLSKSSRATSRSAVGARGNAPALAERPEEVQNDPRAHQAERARTPAEHLVQDLDPVFRGAMDRERPSQDKVATRCDSQMHELTRVDGHGGAWGMQHEQPDSLGDALVGQYLHALECGMRVRSVG